MSGYRYRHGKPGLPECGTYAKYLYHARFGDPVDPACERAARAFKDRAKTKAKEDAKAAADQVKASSLGPVLEAVPRIRQGPPCGTYRAYSSHLYHNEPVCAACRQASRVYFREHQRRRRRANGCTPREPAKCGTYAGYMRHRSRSETACRPCLDAANARNRANRVAKAAREGREYVPKTCRQAACGTVSGYNRHIRLGESTCGQCRSAKNERNRLQRANRTELVNWARSRGGPGAGPAAGGVDHG